MKNITMKKIGKICKEYRNSINITQKTEALDLGYSVENISSFENGRNNNASILIWYLSEGLPVNYICDIFKENEYDNR